MIYAEYDASGTIIAFYNGDWVYPNGIPVNVIQITEDDWQNCLTSPNKYIVQNGTLTLNPNYVPPVPAQ